MSLSRERVRSLIDHRQPAPKVDDPWQDFTEYITISLTLEQEYRHSLGQYSRFFCELAEGRLFGTSCKTCSRVYAPPRTLCPRCQGRCVWHELSGTGRLETFSILHFNADIGEDVRAHKKPILLAYVHLDGSDTLFPHWLHCSPTRAKRGLRVKVAYKQKSVTHPLHLMHFIPDEEN